MTQRAVRCPNVLVLLGNGRGQVLGAEPLHLLAAAHRGDAMEREVPSGTAELCRDAGWCASIRGCERFLSELALAGTCSQCREGASCSLGGDAAWICRG